MIHKHYLHDPLKHNTKIIIDTLERGFVTNINGAVEILDPASIVYALAKDALVRTEFRDRKRREICNVS